MNFIDTTDRDVSMVLLTIVSILVLITAIVSFYLLNKICHEERTEDVQKFDRRVAEHPFLGWFPKHPVISVFISWFLINFLLGLGFRLINIIPSLMNNADSNGDVGTRILYNLKLGFTSYFGIEQIPFWHSIIIGVILIIIIGSFVYKIVREIK